MKKVLFCFVSMLLSTVSLLAATQAVVFDFGGVMTGKPNKDVVICFLRDTFQLSESEFETLNLEKRQAVMAGKRDEDFWLDYANQKGTVLPANWTDAYKTVVKEAIGVNSEMYALVAELKAKQVPVALLSNVDGRLATLIREYGLYEPFNPCLLSYEMGATKPDLKAYEILIKEMNLPASDIVFIDDRKENVEAAKKMGLDAILFRSPNQVRLALHKRAL